MEAWLIDELREKEEWDWLAKRRSLMQQPPTRPPRPPPSPRPAHPPPRPRFPPPGGFPAASQPPKRSPAPGIFRPPTVPVDFEPPGLLRAPPAPKNWAPIPAASAAQDENNDVPEYAKALVWSACAIIFAFVFLGFMRMCFRRRTQRQRQQRDAMIAVYNAQYGPGDGAFGTTRADGIIDFLSHRPTRADQLIDHLSTALLPHGRRDGYGYEEELLQQEYAPDFFNGSFFDPRSGAFRPAAGLPPGAQFLPYGPNFPGGFPFPGAMHGTTVDGSPQGLSAYSEGYSESYSESPSWRSRSDQHEGLGGGGDGAESRLRAGPGGAYLLSPFGFPGMQMSPGGAPPLLPPPDMGPMEIRLRQQELGAPPLDEVSLSGGLAGAQDAPFFGLGGGDVSFMGWAGQGPAGGAPLQFFAPPPQQLPQAPQAFPHPLLSPESLRYAPVPGGLPPQLSPERLGGAPPPMLSPERLPYGGGFAFAGLPAGGLTPERLPYGAWAGAGPAPPFLTPERLQYVSGSGLSPESLSYHASQSMSRDRTADASTSAADAFSAPPGPLLPETAAAAAAAQAAARGLPQNTRFLPVLPSGVADQGSASQQQPPPGFFEALQSQWLRVMGSGGGGGGGGQAAAQAQQQQQQQQPPSAGVPTPEEILAHFSQLPPEPGFGPIAAEGGGYDASGSAEEWSFANDPAALLEQVVLSDQLQQQQAEWGREQVLRGGVPAGAGGFDFGYGFDEASLGSGGGPPASRGGSAAPSVAGGSSREASFRGFIPRRQPPPQQPQQLDQSVDAVIAEEPSFALPGEASFAVYATMESPSYVGQPTPRRPGGGQWSLVEDRALLEQLQQYEARTGGPPTPPQPSRQQQTSPPPEEQQAQWMLWQQQLAGAAGEESSEGEPADWVHWQS